MDIDQMVRKARLAQRGHVFVDTTTCVCGYGSETGEDWERHQVEVALRAVMAPLSTTGEDAETEKLTEGWGVIRPGDRRAHYYRNMDSLCREVGFYRGELDSDNGPSRDDCAACRKVLDREAAKAASG